MSLSQTITTLTRDALAPVETLELRWFFKDSPERAVGLSWFTQSFTDAQFEERTDFYLNRFDKGAFSLKLRQSSIEVKEKQNLPTSLPNSGWAAKGKLERYDKWTFQLSGEDTFVSTVSKGNHCTWLPVDKKRYTTLLQPEGAARPAQLEVTELFVLGEQWWSLALELPFDPTHAAQGLTDVLAHMDEVGQPVFYLLNPKDACGYPAWLETLVKTKSL